MAIFTQKSKSPFGWIFIIHRWYLRYGHWLIASGSHHKISCWTHAILEKSRYGDKLFQNWSSLFPSKTWDKVRQSIFPYLPNYEGSWDPLWPSAVMDRPSQKSVPLMSIKIEKKKKKVNKSKFHQKKKISPKTFVYPKLLRWNNFWVDFEMRCKLEKSTYHQTSLWPN